MNDYFLGILVSSIIILCLEVFKSFDKRLLGSLILTAIAFIYIGFAWNDKLILSIVIVANLFFMSLAYFGIKVHYKFIVAGLVIHGIWDFMYPLFSSSAPLG